jgi:hypothetical protein
MATIPANPSSQLRLVLDFVDSICARDWSTTRRLVTADFVHELLPPSLKRPARGVEELIDTLERGISLMDGFKVRPQTDCCVPTTSYPWGFAHQVTVSDFVEGPSKVWLHVRLIGQSFSLVISGA